jgi:RimJ/RimL family protein N-acetyltransferase
MLAGDLVELRHWRPADAAQVFRICQDPDIQRWTAVPVPYTEADAAGFVGAGDDASFAVIDRASGQLAGSMGVLRFHEGVAAVGYWTAPAMRGAGRTAEALRLITEWCFTVHGCARVELVADVGNAGSRAVARRAGFVEEGVLRARMRHRDQRIDVVMCSRLPTDPVP